MAAPVLVSAVEVLPGPSPAASEELSLCKDFFETEAHKLFIAEVCQILDLSAHKINMAKSFTQLGGHSLSAIVLASACKRLGFALAVESILRSPSLQDLMTSIVITAVASTPNAASVRLLEAKSNKVSLQDTTQNGLSKTPAWPRRLQRTPMTEMQLSMIHGSERRPGANIIRFIESYNPRDLRTIRQAWKRVIDTEPIFATSFEIQDGQGFLLPQRTALFSWTELVVFDEEAYAAELSSDDDLGQGVGNAFRAVTLCEDGRKMVKSTIIWSVHHALIDGYSAAIIHQKLQRAAAGHPITPGYPFDTLINDLQRYQNDTATARQAFWRKQAPELAAAAGDLALAKPEDDLEPGLTGDVTVQIDMKKLNEFARAAGVSSASVIHAAWALVLSTYTDSDLVVFGIVMSGRNLPLPHIEEAVGPLVNTLPLCVRVNKSSSRAELLRQVFSQMIGLATHQCSQPSDGFTRRFSSAMAMEFDIGHNSESKIRSLGQSTFQISSDIPLSIFFSSQGQIRLTFHRDVFQEHDISVLSRHLTRALASLMQPPKDVEASRPELLLPECREEALRYGNCASPKTKKGAYNDDLVTLFEKAAQAHPEHAALERGTQSITYGELDRQAAQAAGHLRQMIKPGDVVCVHADRSLNWIVAIYTVLKAGGVYSPLDAALPQQIRNANYETANAKVFLTPTAMQKSFKPEACSQVWSIPELLSLPRATSEPCRRARPQPNTPAYICFTSGSTGKPKGVVCKHEGLVAFQHDLEVRLFAKPGTRVAQLMSPAFDGSIHEIFSALSYGGTLVLTSEQEAFAHLQRVDSAILTPSIAKVLNPHDFPRLKNVYLVGEPVPQLVNDTWAAEKNLYNMYGPTEGTCGATIKRLRPGMAVSIGPPNPSTRLYILDRHQRLLPPGVVGEIYIAGVQVANGYVGRPEETAQRFVPDSICPELKENMYRTGDRAYWNPNGEVQCLGRNDRQIKLRGYRLDMNDLEIRVLQGNPQATAVAITPRDDFLVAMIQPGSLDPAQVRASMTAVLPAHAIPRYISVVDRFPMTPAGKLDYKAIAVRVDSDSESSTETSGLSDLETSIANIWRDMLSLVPSVAITADSSFIALGGHSIKQLQLASKLSTLTGQRIPLKTVVSAPTLRQLAEAISGSSESTTSATSSSSTITALGCTTPSPIERDWWQKYQLAAGTSSFNVSISCMLDPSLLDVDRLAKSFDVVLGRHRVLRSGFLIDQVNGLVRRINSQPLRVSRPESIDITKASNQPFRLDQDALVRVMLSPTQLCLSISHILCDLTTLQVLLREVTRVYHDQTLSPVERELFETTTWSERASEDNLAFWGRQLSSLPSPSKQQRPRVSYEGTTRILRIQESIHARLRAHCTRTGVTMHQMALAAVGLALQGLQPSVDVVLGGPYFNRPSADLDTVGLFLEPLPIRVQFTPTSAYASSEAYLAAVQRASQLSLAHAVPWDQLLQHLGASHQKQQHPEHPLLDTMVTFHDHGHGAGGASLLDLPGVRPTLTWTQGAKFRLLVEFSALSESVLVLRLEYDTQCYLPGEIAQVEARILAAMDALLAENGSESAKSFATVQEQIKAASPLIGREAADAGHDVFYGRPLDELDRIAAV